MDREHRGKTKKRKGISSYGIRGKRTVCTDSTQKKIKIYLVTDHTGFYERYGWEFLCMVQGDGEPDMTRMYIHR